MKCGFSCPHKYIDLDEKNEIHFFCHHHYTAILTKNLIYFEICEIVGHHSNVQSNLYFQFCSQYHLAMMTNNFTISKISWFLGQIPTVMVIKKISKKKDFGIFSQNHNTVVINQINIFNFFLKITTMDAKNFINFNFCCWFFGQIHNIVVMKNNFFFF